MGDPFRKMSDEEQRKWDEKLLNIAFISTLVLSFAAAAFVDYTNRQTEQDIAPNTPVQTETPHPAVNDNKTAPNEDQNTTAPTQAAPDTLILQPSQFKIKMK